MGVNEKGLDRAQKCKNGWKNNDASIRDYLNRFTVSVACVLPGVFLILRGISMMSDAISHAVLLGIVLSFFVIKDLDSPLLIVGASLAGVLTVSLTELLIQ